MAKRVPGPKKTNKSPLKNDLRRSGDLKGVVNSSESIAHVIREPESSRSYTQRPRRVAYVMASYEEARSLLAANNILLKADYKRFRKTHPNLPYEPEKHYGSEFKNWNHFVGRPEYYESIEQAQAAVRKLGLKSVLAYNNACKVDLRLPYNPANVYPTFPGYEIFLGIGEPPYGNYEEASEAAKRLGITSQDGYRKKRIADPKLPSSPISTYSSSWKGWAHFLQISPRIPKDRFGENTYYNWEQFGKAVMRMQIKTQQEYIARCKEDLCLPKWPERTYADVWPGWGKAMVGRARYACATWQEARAVALHYRFDGYSSYRARFKEDDRLPADPTKKYPDFPGWPDFLLPDVFKNLEDLKLGIKILNIKNEEAYHSVRAKYSNLPEDPESSFSGEWVDWYDACGFMTPYTYCELQSIAQSHGCRTLKDYRALVKKLDDPKMIYRPEAHYKEWVNVYEFLNQDLPNLLSFVSKRSAGWIADVAYWIESSPVINTKEYSICKFIRHYIEPNGYGSSVKEFLLLKHVDTVQFERFIDSQGTPANCRRTWFEIQEYLDNALRRHYYAEDESGKIYRTHDAANPLAAIKFNGANHTPSESTKPPLAYQFVKAVKDWIIPSEARTLSDLANIHAYDADYIAVDSSVIDLNDPNCVFRKTGDQYYLWIPTYWIALYTLVSVPARARQVMYNDSGEADEYIVSLVDGRPVWLKNTSFLMEAKRQQAFVSRDQHENWGMHFTSNKTSYDGGGYDVPWIPEALVYWLTIFRDWQAKYNPITKTTRWVDCARRCNFSKMKLKKKVDACFLFRGFGEDQPPIFAGSIARRLAAALYNIQPDDLVLASFDDSYEKSERVSKSTLTRYSSEFTTHSMRVSLITAYVMKFGMPVEIVMKIVGHASIVMTLYYIKIGSASVRQAMAEGEKRALQDCATDIQVAVEQKRLDYLKNQMIGSTREAVDALLAGHSGTQRVRDYGICPYAGSRCTDGGEMAGKTRLPVQAGHLGLQNCPRCRHFVTGPAFLGGLIALWNEISLVVNLNWQSHADLDEKLDVHRSRLQQLRNEQYDCEQTGRYFDDFDIRKLNVGIRKLESEQEGVVTKMDMYICDLQSLAKLISECQAVLKSNNGEEHDSSSATQLIVTDNREIEVSYEEVSLFYQLNEVCQNAVIYESSSSVMATSRRSQMLDRLAINNGISPVMMNLSEGEQLKLGNQVCNFLFERIGNRTRVDELVSGRLNIRDLQEDYAISVKEIASLLNSSSTLNSREFAVRYDLA